MELTPIPQGIIDLDIAVKVSYDLMNALSFEPDLIPLTSILFAVLPSFFSVSELTCWFLKGILNVAPAMTTTHYTHGESTLLPTLAEDDHSFALDASVYETI
jgi:hypothetical protein